MRALLASLILACAAAGAVQACSSSAIGPPAGGGDAGGAHDGTAVPTEGGGGGDAQTFDVTASNDAGADTATSGGDAAPQDSAVKKDASGGDAAPEAGPDAAGDAGQDATGVVDCGSTPTLHVEEAGTIYCGFEDAGSLACPTGQECCLGGSLGGGAFAPQQCAAFGAVCTNGLPGSDAGSPAIPIMCSQLSDCTANGLSHAVACCLQGATAPTVQPTCAYPKATLGTAVVCESSDAGATGPAPCAAGEAQICSSQADCPSGTTCTPGKWKIYQVGFCL